MLNAPAIPLGGKNTLSILATQGISMLKAIQLPDTTSLFCFTRNISKRGANCLSIVKAWLDSFGLAEGHWLNLTPGLLVLEAERQQQCGMLCPTSFKSIFNYSIHTIVTAEGDCNGLFQQVSACFQPNGFFLIFSHPTAFFFLEEAPGLKG